MYLYNFDIYASQYQPGIKKISFYKYFSKIIDGKVYLKNKVFDRYDLYFSQSGLLTQSFHYKEDPTKKVYAYNSKAIPVSILELTYNQNEFVELTEYSYDDQDRITEEFIKLFWWSPFASYEKQIHKYQGDMEEITLSIKGILIEEEHYTILKTINDVQYRMEEKKTKNKDDIFEWNKYEYDNNGILINKFWWDKTQNKFVLDQKESEPEVVWEDKFEYNHKGAWVKMITLRNGEPRFYYERNIEYYL